MESWDVEYRLIKEIDKNLVKEGNIDLGDKVFKVLAHDLAPKFSERG